MGKYILKRLGLAAVVIVLTMFLLGLLVHLVPGDPVKIILGPRASESLSRVVRAEMQLDEPVLVQVWSFVRGAATGDLGRDFVSQLPVTSLIQQAFPHTVLLAVSGLGLATLFGVPLGVYAATRPNSWIDRLTAILSVSLITVPPFVAGVFLLLLFAVELSLLPAIGAGELGNTLDYLKHLVLPSTALAVTWMGYIARLVRTSMLEILGANYSRTAFAFGLPRRQIFYKYALKNAIIPTIAVLGVGLGTLIANAVFVEIIFSRPGLGALIVDSISTRNYPIVRGGILVVVVIVVAANLVADLSYRLLDPRIRFEAEGS
ncbi:MAG: ABC transporter permease [Actinomycetota bacterium]|nr:ABC transporter permease [Actinomycetota bacterium]